jgi:tetratricopeptide (TPR) repeat protein
VKLALVALVWLGAGAAADPHKPAPDKFAASAATIFDKAVAAESAHHWRNAIELYHQAYDLSPHPNAIFNVAALEAEHGDVEPALVAYQIYLELAPAASDRAQVEARMAELIAQKRPRMLVVGRGLVLEDGYVIVDGDIVARPGQIRDGKLELAYGRGRHWVAVVTPISYGATAFGETGEYGDTEHSVIVNGQNRADGNLLALLDYDYAAELEGKPVSHEGVRMTAKPGAHWLKVRDRKHECAPVKLDLPGGEDVQFVYVAPTEWFDHQELERCRAYGPKQQRLRFKTK